MPHALIQLVSEQTLPNVFPALALRSDRTILLHTPETVPQCGWIARALSLAGQSSPPVLIALPENPGHQATGQAVLTQIKNARADGLTPVVNITGGTKLMSIGAFAAAHQQRVPAFYFDTAHRTIHAATATPLPAPLDSSPTALRLITDQLSVSILTAAHGITQYIPGRDPAPWLDCARLLAADSNLEQAAHDFAINHLAEGYRKPADYARILDTPLDIIPDPLIEPLYSAGHIFLRDGHWYLWHAAADTIRRWANGERYESHLDYFATVAPLQQMIAFLMGGWWELAVFDAAHASGRLRDLQWSAQAGRTGGSTPIEEDILGVEDLSLAVISCKRGGERPRLLRAFEELDSAARTLGGSFTRRYLAVAMPLPGHAVTEIQARAANTRTTLLGPVKHFGPASFASHT